MATFKIKLTFQDLHRDGASIAGTEEYADATLGDVHAGSTFDGSITMGGDATYDFLDILNTSLQIVFWVTSDED